MLRALLSFLSKLTPKRSPSLLRPSITDAPHWHIVAADFWKVLRALPRFAPPGSILGLTEGAWSREFERFLRERAVGLDPEVRSTVPWEFLDSPFIPVDPSTIQELATLADRQAEWDVAIHLIVLAPGRTFLEWYDLPRDPIAVSSSVEEAAVARFAQAVGGRHELSRPGI